MKNLTVLAIMILSSALCLRAGERSADAFGLSNIKSWLHPGGADVHQHRCDKCGGIHDPDGPCIERYPVQDCVVGKKKVYDSKIMCEYVSIPETRYRWKKKLITKEIPCPYCKPVCKSKDCEHCFGEEKWQKEGTSCDELHCKYIQPKYEKLPTKYCDHDKGETTIKVHYWSCVKEPYTIYRRVKKEVCVKERRYEKVKVPVTRYVCEHCDGGGCDQCDTGCSQCDDAGCLDYEE